MLLRLYALCGNSRVLRAFLAILFISEIGLVWVASTELASTMEGMPPYPPNYLDCHPHRSFPVPVTVEPFPGIRACTVVAMGGSPYLLYFPVMTFELVLFALTVWTFVRRYKALRQIQVGWSRATLLINVLIFGNMYYFF